MDTFLPILVAVAIFVLFYIWTVVLANDRNKAEHFNYDLMQGERPSILDAWKKSNPEKWIPAVKPEYYQLQKGDIHTSYGTPNPLKPSPMILENVKEIVSVDGTDTAPRSLAVFSYNKFSPECCAYNNGGYSTSSGCVCVTQQQNKWFADVGGNRKNGTVGI